MKKILLLLSTLFCITIFLVGCSKPKEIDISKYIEISESGYDTLGDIDITLKRSFFDDSNIFPSDSIDYSTLRDYDVSISTNKDSKLKNGDNIEIQIDYNKDLYRDEFNVILTNSKNIYTVSNLEKIFLKKEDLTNDEYSKLKSETEKSVTNYFNSYKSLDRSFDNFKFIDLFIKRIHSDSSDVPDRLSLVYLYSIEEHFDVKIHKADYIKYAFVPVYDIKFNSDGRLDTYKISSPDSGNILPYDKNNTLPTLDVVKGDYLQGNESFERVEIQ